VNKPEDVPQTVEPRPFKRGLVFVFILISTFIAAIEQTIVATAMPAIVADLGDFSLYGWVFSGFMLTQAASVPIFGRLADIYGRRPILVSGLAIFLAASLMCGFAWSMASLIGFRLLQGLGAGALQPIAITIMGDLFAPRERPRAQAFISTVWAMSAILGPITGGLIVQHGVWSWVFWISIPFGFVAMVGLIITFKEQVVRRRHQIDYLGACLFSIGVGALMVICVQGGIHWPWDSTPVLVLGVISLVAGILFLYQEWRTPEPMVPLDLWRTRIVLTGTMASFFAGLGTLGLVSYVPVYVQGILGGSAIEAGLTLTVSSISWPMASFGVKYFCRWFGEQGTIRLGGFLLAFSLGSLFTVTPESGSWHLMLCTFPFGFGMGLFNTTTTIVIQHSVPWQRRGSATAAIFFMRTLGGTLGVAVLSGILNGVIRNHLQDGGGMSPGRVTELLARPRGTSIDQVPPHLAEALSSGLHYVFAGMGIAGLILFVFTMLMPATSAMSADDRQKGA
jgi:EmrB/QacA subfamily drug resistance transporter